MCACTLTSELYTCITHVCSRTMAVARVYGGGVPDPVTLVTAVYGNRHRSPGDVAAPCALKSETPRPRWRFSRRARAPVPVIRRRGRETHVHCRRLLRGRRSAHSVRRRRRPSSHGVAVEIRNSDGNFRSFCGIVPNFQSVFRIKERFQKTRFRYIGAFYRRMITLLVAIKVDVYIDTGIRYWLLQMYRLIDIVSISDKVKSIF